MTAPQHTKRKFAVKVKTDNEILEELYRIYKASENAWLNQLHMMQRTCSHPNIVESTRYADKTHRMCLDCRMREATRGVLFRFLKWKTPEGPVPYSAPPSVPVDWLLKSSAGFTFNADNEDVKREVTQAELVDKYFAENLGFPKENET